MHDLNKSYFTTTGERNLFILDGLSINREKEVFLLLAALETA